MNWRVKPATLRKTVTAITIRGPRVGGDAAMEVLERERPDCITLDLEMPHEWGPRFYRKFSQKEEFKDLPVVVISGLTGHDMAIRKAVAAIHKPFEPEAVLAAVRKACGDETD